MCVFAIAVPRSAITVLTDHMQLGVANDIHSIPANDNKYLPNKDRSDNSVCCVCEFCG